jgi:hypothetical protein
MDWRWSSMVEHIPCMHKSLGLIPRPEIIIIIIKEITTHEEQSKSFRESQMVQFYTHTEEK